MKIISFCATKLPAKVRVKREYLGLTSVKYKYFFNTSEHVSLTKISYKHWIQLAS